MTTPNDNTPASILEDAYFDSGYLQEGQTLNSEQIVRGMRRMTGLINTWQVKDGLRLWLNQDTPITLTTGIGLYTLGPTGTVAMVKPLRVIDAYWLSAAGIRRSLSPLARLDYDRLSQINQSGTINSYFVDKQATTLNVFFWMPPDATDALGTAHVVLQNQVTNFTNVTEDMNFPLEWRMALHWGMADELSTGQPQSIMDRCQGKAEMYYAMLSAWDVEDAPTYFTYDSRGSAASKFR